MEGVLILKELVKMTKNEFMAKGEAMFGKNLMDWKFKCPAWKGPVLAVESSPWHYSPFRYLVYRGVWVEWFPERDFQPYSDDAWVKMLIMAKASGEEVETDSGVGCRIMELVDKVRDSSPLMADASLCAILERLQKLNESDILEHIPVATIMSFPVLVCGEREADVSFVKKSAGAGIVCWAVA